eukprot:88355-Hanusia_phi.AAC.1
MSEIVTLLGTGEHSNANGVIEDDEDMALIGKGGFENPCLHCDAYCPHFASMSVGLVKNKWGFNRVRGTQGRRKVSVSVEVQASGGRVGASEAERFDAARDALEQGGGHVNAEDPDSDASAYTDDISDGEIGLLVIILRHHARPTLRTLQRRSRNCTAGMRDRRDEEGMGRGARGGREVKVCSDWQWCLETVRREEETNACRREDGTRRGWYDMYEQSPLERWGEEGGEKLAGEEKGGHKRSGVKLHEGDCLREGGSMRMGSSCGEGVPEMQAKAEGEKGGGEGGGRGEDITGYEACAESLGDIVLADVGVESSRHESPHESPGSIGHVVEADAGSDLVAFRITNHLEEERG